MNNPEQERERLSNLYAGMNEEELEKIGSTGYELSDVARQENSETGSPAETTTPSEPSL